jgi:two-component system, sensor histidine kinase LadS
VGKKDYTLEALATQLELRVNTLWGFKHKVSERIGELEKGGRKPHASRWEDVILVPDSAAKPSKKSPAPQRETTF